MSVGLLGLVVAQGVLGMLTVTWQLKPLIVTAHLLLGLATLGTLYWLWRSLRQQTAGTIASAQPRRATARAAPWVALVALFAVGMQIALGGWTSSNYAATACPDFPRCQDSWWPAADYGEAFVMWRGLGRNYEGGVLELPARVAIQFAHRMGAAALTLLLLAAGLRALRRPATARAGGLLLATLVLQLLLGSFMVLRGFPLWLATAHNAGAALLLLATLSFLLATRAARRAAAA